MARKARPAADSTLRGMSPARASPDSARAARRPTLLPLRTAAAFVLAVLAVLSIATFSWRAQRERAGADQGVAHTLAVLVQLEGLLSNLKDAETGQRGFLLTGTESYLDPYETGRSAVPGRFAALRSLLEGNAAQVERLSLTERITFDKLAELAQTIASARAGDAAAALATVRTDRGQADMERLRALVSEMQAEERRVLAARQQEADEAAASAARVIWGGSALLLFLIALAASLASREYRQARAKAWVRAGHAGLAEVVQGEQRLDVLGDNALAYLARYLDAQAGALFVDEAGEGRADAGVFRRVAGFALAPGAAHVLRPGDGLLGQVAKEGRALRVRDVPEGYLPVSSALGRADARELIVAPASVDGSVQAVLELGFLGAVDDTDLALLERCAELLGIAVRSARDRSRLEALLQETQAQAEELQAQQEELRVSNEELEEQAQVRKEAQARLELQQVELEQTNTQLEEQADLLATQKANLLQAHADLGARAAELERVSRYKSEFLANMSHELRTPLNSTLILAKLLADNKSGNLSDDQVRFARTISDAGNDLLVLINDILDLSKVEAGKVEIRIESVDVARLVDDLLRPLRPLAQQKGLGCDAVIEPGAPARIETDPQRLGQILKNLLSNAIKFTEAGSVTLRVRADAAQVAFAVHDSGIGVAQAQQSMIFEAFRQADGSTHRKYGGTGLGLSISRDLARLLGGDIAVQSAPGAGSVFTLSLPLASATPSAHRGDEPAALSAVADVLRPLPPAVSAPPHAPPSPIEASGTPSGRRSILVIEDDTRFAAILSDLVREMGYECIVTHTASDGLAAAASQQPSAILLDVNLPDGSGLAVLDRLKHDPLTRHVPVHVASVAELAREALELGAVGYLLKPVPRERLVEAVRQLEAKFLQQLRRVLVVEDDPRQRDAIRQLLGTPDVEILCVETAAEALAALGASTFDCMVMDLNLPDLSGYELLEKMSTQEHVPFPPVIVYTGHSLDADEEQRLRRYSKAIIVKDVRSPERLLDEVTLFLHQVESHLPVASQQLLQRARDRDAALDGRTVLIVEDDVRNVFALSSVLESKGAKTEIARNGREALEALGRHTRGSDCAIDLVLMDIMMPEMDGYSAMQEIRRRADWKKLPIIALTAKAMKDDQEKCIAAGANDYIAKPLDVERLLSLARVWVRK